MRELFGTVLRLRFLVAALAAVLLVVGLARLRSMPVDVLPEFGPPLVEVQTEAVGLSAEEVEELITVPLEQNLLNGVAWLDTIRSESVSGLSSVTLVFLPGTDLYRARQMVAERLAQGAPTLPRVSRGPVMLQPKSASSRVLVVRLSSNSLSAIEMSVLARWTITPRLMGVPGVANVATWGMKDRQLQVQVDPDRLQAYQVSLLQIVESVGNALWVSALSFVEASTPGNAGFIDTPQQRLGIRHVTPIVSADSLSKVFVQGTGTLLIDEGKVDLSRLPKSGGAVRLMDVADVVEGHQPLIGDALAGDGANLLLLIEKAPGSDTVQVTRGVEEALATLRPGLGDMEFDSSLFRPATFIEAARANLARVLLWACAIVVVLIGLLFFDWRAVLVGLVAIPLSLMTALTLLYWCGATLNSMVLTGLVVASGLLVHDVIVVIDGMKRRGPLEGLLESSGGVLFGALVGLLAVLPCFFVQGILGDLLRPLVVAYVVAVLASTFVALIVTPALCAILLRGGSHTPAFALHRGLAAAHENMLRRLLFRPRSAYLALAILAAVGLGATPFLRWDLLPAFAERDILIRLDAAPGTSLPGMVRLVNRAMGALRSIPGVSDVGALVGRAELGDRIVGVDSAEVLVHLAPTADYGATVGALRTTMSAYPGITCAVETNLARLTDRIVEKTSAPIVVRLYGQDWTTLRDESERLRRELSGIAGVDEVAFSLPAEEPTLEVEVDLTAASAHGINPGQVRRAASTMVNGMQVGSLFQEQKVFDVVVWSTPKSRGGLLDVRDLLIDTPFHVPVRLGDVAQVRMQPRPSVIRHQDVSRYVDIAVAVTGRSARSVADDLRSHLRRTRFPLEYHAKVFGAFERERAARLRLLSLVTIAAIGTLLLVQAAYGSWRLAVLSLLALAGSCAGGLVALALAAPQISLGAVFGLLAILGIAASNQFMLIRSLRRMEQERTEAPGPELVLRGVRERFDAVLTTALTLSLAVVPVLLGGVVPGLEILRPMALVILSGLVSATIVHMFVLPASYLHRTRPAP